MNRLHKSDRDYYSRLREIEVVEVIRIAVNEGDGIEGDPITGVTYWYTKDGTLIGHNDDIERQFVPNKETGV